VEFEDELEDELDDELEDELVEEFPDELSLELLFYPVPLIADTFAKNSLRNKSSLYRTILWAFKALMSLYLTAR